MELPKPSSVWVFGVAVLLKKEVGKVVMEKWQKAQGKADCGKKKVLELTTLEETMANKARSDVANRPRYAFTKGGG